MKKLFGNKNKDFVWGVYGNKNELAIDWISCNGICTTILAIFPSREEARRFTKSRNGKYKIKKVFVEEVEK